MGWKGYLVCVFLIFLGWTGSSENKKKDKERSRLATSGIRVEGMIVQGQSREGRSTNEHKFDVEFQLGDGELRRKNFEVDEKFFDKHTNTAVITDPIVTVVYDAGNPRKAYLEGTKTHSFPTWMCYAFLVGGIGGIVGGMFKKK